MSPPSGYMDSSGRDAEDLSVPSSECFKHVILFPFGFHDACPKQGLIFFPTRSNVPFSPGFSNGGKERTLACVRMFIGELDNSPPICKHLKFFKMEEISRASFFLPIHSLIMRD